MTSARNICFLILLGVYLTETEGRLHGRSAHRIVKRQTAVCDSTTPKYRRMDGQCNNLINQFWGSASVNMDRMARAAYGDTIQTPRTKGASGNILPSAREVSLKCHPANDVRADVTLMVMQWGQFVDHDITATPHVLTDENGEPLVCTCKSTNSECFPISLSNDEYFKSRACLEFTRSASVFGRDSLHNTAVRQQANSITAYIDASNVYGSSDEEVDALRGSNGGMKDTTLGSSYLPEGSNTSCKVEAVGDYCFVAGDFRVNEQPGLAAMHTIFMREHNRIAKIFKDRTSWVDDRIFQETRRIIGAMVQIVTYKEFLPTVLGPVYMKNYMLDATTPFEYDNNKNAGVINAFATAAFRFGHSLIPDSVTMASGTFDFKNAFFSPSVVLQALDDLAFALTTNKAMSADAHFAHAVTRHLFQDAEQSGTDLVALNIQRGRDHGLPAYNKFRQLCHQPPLKSLKDLFPGDPEAASAYSSIDDVDLFTGAMAEKLVDGGLVGPTFACILSTQFQRFKFGDRFFHLTTDTTVGFTQSQRDELRKVSLSKIICENTENKKVQGNVFLPADRHRNSKQDCRELPSIDLAKWTGSGTKDRGSRKHKRKIHRG